MTDEQLLVQLRAEIDECDGQLVQLLAKRTALTSKIGAIKQKVGAALHVPRRESSLIKARRSQAQQHNVNPDLVEDILRRMMREAYENQQSELACKAPQLSPIVIVGGEGAMGQLFAKQLRRSGYEIKILDIAQQANVKEILAGAMEPVSFVETLFSLLFFAAIGIRFSVYWFNKENTIFRV